MRRLAPSRLRASPASLLARSPSSGRSATTRSSCLRRRQRDIPLESPIATPTRRHARDNAPVAHAWSHHMDPRSANPFASAPNPPTPIAIPTISTEWSANQDAILLIMHQPQSKGDSHALVGILAHLVGPLLPAGGSRRHR